MVKIREYTDIRDAFGDWAEDYPEGWGNLDVFAANVNGKKLRLHELLERLEGSGDIMPYEYCACLELPQGSTYGDAVDLIQQELGIEEEEEITEEGVKPTE